MDLSKFKTSDWLKAGGGLVMLIAYFLTWWSYDLGSGVGSTDSVSGSEYFFTGTVPWILLVAIGVLTVLAALDVFKLPSTIPTPLIFLAASALSLLLLIIRLFGPGGDIPDEFDEFFSRGVGLYLAILAAIAVVAGCVLGFQESGGNLNDLKDINKMKGQFGGAGGSAPPPPPGMTSPPPPPPPGGSAPPPPPPPMG